MRQLNSPTSTPDADAFAAFFSPLDAQVRRPERTLSPAEARRIIEATPWAVLSTIDETGRPYGVPVSAVLLGNDVYFHGSCRGRRGRGLAAHPAVSLTWVGAAKLDMTDFATDFVSVVAEGHAELVEDPAEMKTLLFRLSDALIPHTDAEKDAYFERYGAGVSLWRVRLSRVSGKARNKRIFFGNSDEGVQK